MSSLRPYVAWGSRESAQGTPLSVQGPPLVQSPCIWVPWAIGRNLGHLHSLYRHGPLSPWMNSECRHQEQAVARLASRSIQRTSERWGFEVMGASTVGHAVDTNIRSLGPFSLGRMTYLAVAFAALSLERVERV
jgi:hypothetical protein